MNSLSIHEIAQRTGLTSHTLRYYERIGLISPVGRAAGGQRRYSEADIAWVEFLLRLRMTRMPIAQMQMFVKLRNQGDTTYGERRLILEAHLAELQQTIEEMAKAADVLAEKIAFYKRAEQDRLVRPEA